MNIKYYETFEDQLYNSSVWMLKNNFRQMIIYVANKYFEDRIKLYLKQKVKVLYNYEEYEEGRNGIFIVNIEKVSLQSEIPFVIISSSYFKKANLSIILESPQEHRIVMDVRKTEKYKSQDAAPVYSTVPGHLRDKEIYEMFLKTFDIAENEIDIISPWMSTSVIDESFIERMERALDRGIRIMIRYGMNDSHGSFNASRENKSDMTAEMLKNRFEKYGPAFSVIKDNIHYKLVLCDDKYKLEGGYNYLSFKGTYDGDDMRKEGSPYGTDKEEICRLRRIYFR